MLIWILTRMAYSIAVIMTAFLAFVSAFFALGAFATLLEMEILMMVLALVMASNFMFLSMLCKSCAAWLHDKYF